MANKTQIGSIEWRRKKKREKLQQNRYEANGEKLYPSVCLMCETQHTHQLENQLFTSIVCRECRVDCFVGWLSYWSMWHIVSSHRELYLTCFEPIHLRWIGPNCTWCGDGERANLCDARRWQRERDGK